MFYFVLLFAVSVCFLPLFLRSLTEFCTGLAATALLVAGGNRALSALQVLILTL